MALLLIIGPSISFAQESCRYAFTKAGDESYGSLRKAFVHTTKYTVEDTVQSPIKDQCVLGTCHLQGWASILETDHAKRSGKMIEISTDYLAFSHWIYEATGAILQSGKDLPKKLDLSASEDYSRSLFTTFGIVPKSAWQPKIPLEDGWVTRMEKYILNIVVRTRLTLEQETDSEKKRLIRYAANEKIMKIFEDQVGPLPQKFVYNGATYDPGAFQKKFFPELAEPQMGISVNPKRDTPTENYKFKNEEWVQTDLVSLESVIKAQLNQGRSVYLMYDHNKEFVDNASGIMSISAFKFPAEGRPLSRRDRSMMGPSDLGHVVVVTGYDLDPKTGKFIKLKIKNSWSSRYGDRGYYHMYRDYFRAFAKAVSVPREAALSLVTGKQPIILEQ